MPREFRRVLVTDLVTTRALAAAPPIASAIPSTVAQPDRADACGQPSTQTAAGLLEALPAGGRMVAVREVVGMARPILLICPPGEGMHLLQAASAARS